MQKSLPPQSDILNTYETGRGSVKMRAIWTKEDGDVIVTALPFQVLGLEDPGADSGADAQQKAAYGGGSAR